MKKNTCPVCGKQINQEKHVEGGRPKRFCSPRCRGIYHCRASQARKRGAEVGPDGHPLRPGRKCSVCGKEIDPRKVEGTVCCSDACSQKRSNRLRYGLPVGDEEFRAFCENRKAERLAKRKREELRAKERAYRATHPRHGTHQAGRNVAASKARNAAPNLTFVQKRENPERESIARVEAYLRLPAAERFAQLETLTKKEQAMAREMWMRLKCSRPVYYTAMAN